MPKLPLGTVQQAVLVTPTKPNAFDHFILLIPRRRPRRQGAERVPAPLTWKWLKTCDFHNGSFMETKAKTCGLPQLFDFEPHTRKEVHRPF